MKIRKARKEELKEIAKIFKNESSKKPYFQKWTAKKALDEVNSFFKTKDIYIAVIDKSIAGFIIAQINLNNRKKAYMDELWLKSEFQRREIGKALVKHIENKYRKQGVRIMLVASNKKSGAFHFYKKLKYTESKELTFMDKKL